MPKFKVGDIVDYEDINESGARFWSTNWKVIALIQDGYHLQHVGEPPYHTGYTFLPFWAESKMRLTEQERDYTPEITNLSMEELIKERADYKERLEKYKPTDSEWWKLSAQYSLRNMELERRIGALKLSDIYDEEERTGKPFRGSIPQYGRTATEILKQETAPIEETSNKEELLSRMMLLLGVAGSHRDVSNTLRAGMYAAYTTIDSADGRRVFVQDFAASLNRNGLLSNDKVDEFTRLGYELMEASE